jgi:hypothetical protein
VIAETLLHLSVRLAATPAPTPSGTPSDDSVTPGVVGFTVTFLIAVAVVLLVLDMVRRIRRVRYRAEIAEKLDAEQQDRRAVDPDLPDDSDAPTR